MTNQQRMALLSSVSTRRMLAVAADLEALNLQPGGGDLDRACERLMGALRQGGAHRVELKSYPCGPEQRYFSWWMERQPFTEEAELWLVLPGGEEVLVCRASDNPACSMGAFRSTGGEGEVLEVVDVGFGTRPTDYRSHRMRGKLALASGHHFEAVMLEALAERQAEGLLCGPGGAVEEPSHVVPNRLGDPSLFGTHRPFGFNLSATQLNQLLSLLAGGAEVRARVRLRAALDSGALPAAVATLEGAELAQEEVLLVAHLGQDEGTLGVACAGEVLRSLATLAVQGHAPPLRRTLRVLMTPDERGTVAWLAEERPGRGGPRAVLHLSVPSPASATDVRILAPPPGQPSFVPDLLQSHLRWASGARGSFSGDLPLSVRCGRRRPGSALLPFTGDQGLLPTALVCDGGAKPVGVLRGGAVIHGPLRRLTAGLAATVLDLCNLAHEDLPRLICGSAIAAHQRLARRAEELADRVEQELHHPEPSARDASHLLWRIEQSLAAGRRHEERVLRSCGDYLQGPGSAALTLAEATGQLEQLTDALGRRLSVKVTGAIGGRRLSVKRRRLSALERRAAGVVPRRQVEGPLPVPLLLREAAPADRSWLAHNAAALAEQPSGELLLHQIDGQRTLLDVYDRLSVEQPEADLKLLWRYLELLRGAGVVELLEVSTVISAPNGTRLDEA